VSATPTGKTLPEFTAGELREYLASGQADLAVVYDQQLAFARAVEDRIHAFASLDERVIRLQATHRKAERERGEPLGRLYGVPVAVKDIIDTVDFPTALGSPIHDGRYAVADATVVRRLRDAGAVIFGKTVTTEFATFTPGPTRNPHDPEHTPGGSSSGSAAAVAAGVVPVALGTQTNGSVLRPASYCGVYGFKPSRGLLPRTGVFEQSPSLDQLGVFARSIEDLALVAEILSGDDDQDRGSLGQAPRQLLSVCRAEPPVEPRFCFVRTPWWDQVDAEAREACEAFVELMQGLVVTAELPAVVEQAVAWHQRVNEAELAFALQRELRDHPAQLSDALRQRVEAGMRMPVIDYLNAKDRIPHVACAFDGYFERYDAILCPAALGAAPKGLASTGNPLMQTVWAFGGLPSLSLPLLHLSGGLPLGVQAVGALHNDARLLRSCRWLVEQFIQRGRT
jgi:Asp-tRNA(Asn)/Glu-tRNA(Gln) amidotransferase A subunit family amidase